MAAGRDLIVFSSDYGLGDPFVGVCHAVIARLAPRARVIDLTHGIPPHDVRSGALTLADCIPYLAPAVHLAVVDPGVGTGRRAVVVRSGEHFFVGPDNGLLTPAAERAGGPVDAWELTARGYRLEPVSATFHGRDVFAPAAAHLASGTAPGSLGPRLDPGGLVTLDLPVPLHTDGQCSGEVVTVDGFGNAALSLHRDDLDACGLALGDRVAVRVDDTHAEAAIVEAFGEVPPGELAVLVDSFGRVALAVNGGDAARLLGAVPTAPVTVSRRPSA